MNEYYDRIKVLEFSHEEGFRRGVYLKLRFRVVESSVPLRAGLVDVVTVNLKTHWGNTEAYKSWLACDPKLDDVISVRWQVKQSVTPERGEFMVPTFYRAGGEEGGGS